MKLLAISASLRKESLNKKLLANAIGFAKDLGIATEILDLQDYLLPAYDEDIEAKGFPAAAERLRDRLNAVPALLIASPEYNFSFPGHFKNTFDWLSRFRPQPWPKKLVYLMSASPSLVGGNRSLWALRVPFETCGAIVYPSMFSLASASQAFDETGVLKDAKMADRLKNDLKEFLQFAEAIVPTVK